MNSSFNSFSWLFPTRHAFLPSSSCELPTPFPPLSPFGRDRDSSPLSASLFPGFLRNSRPITGVVLFHPGSYSLRSHYPSSILIIIFPLSSCSSVMWKFFSSFCFFRSFFPVDQGGLQQASDRILFAYSCYPFNLNLIRFGIVPFFHLHLPSFLVVLESFYEGLTKLLNQFFPNPMLSSVPPSNLCFCAVFHLVWSFASATPLPSFL